MPKHLALPNSPQLEVSQGCLDISANSSAHAVGAQPGGHTLGSCPLGQELPLPNFMTPHTCPGPGLRSVTHSGMNP